MFTWKKACATAFAGAVGVGMTFAGAGMAAATPNVITFPDLPGGAPGGQAVVTDGTDATVTVDSVDLTTGEVKGTIENTGDNDLNCYVGYSLGLDNGNIDGVVSNSDLIGQTVDYYNTNLVTPGGGGGLLPQGLLSDSLGNVMGSMGMDQNTLPAQADNARMQGQFADVDSSTLDPVASGATENWTAQLSPKTPDNAKRDSFDAAAAFLCQDTTTDKVFLYTGDEDGDAVTGGDSGTGSLSSLTGSLGSATGSSDS